MKKVVIALIIILFTLPQSFAANTPCSGRKGGVSHCQGSTFVCNDGSVSGSKKDCSIYMGGSARGFLGNNSSSEMKPAASGDCSCRSGKHCIGPRGGRYCYTDSGNKSYLKK